MRDVVAAVFDTRESAYHGLHELWRLDSEDQIAVHGAGVVHRDLDGRLSVETGDGNPPIGTTVGIVLGALLGLLAGPTGAVLGAARGAAAGAASGGFIGLEADAANASTLEQGVDESGSVVPPGHYAVVGDLEEASPAVLEARMKALGATLHRKPKTAIADDKWKGLDPFFVPYDYDPHVAADAT